MHTLPFSFLSSFTIVIFINCNLTMYREKGKLNSKRGRERLKFFIKVGKLIYRDEVPAEQELPVDQRERPVRR